MVPSITDFPFPVGPIIRVWPTSSTLLLKWKILSLLIVLNKFGAFILSSQDRPSNTEDIGSIYPSDSEFIGLFLIFCFIFEGIAPKYASLTLSLSSRHVNPCLFITLITRSIFSSNR